MRVMLVDDENLALMRLKRLLEAEGIDDIHCFNDPYEALKEASKRKFDAVFLDISMPNMSGLELASEIINIEPQTYILFQTAHQEYALEAFKHGGMDYLLKPVDDLSLQEALKKITQFQTRNKSHSQRLMGKRGNKLYLIDMEDIYYIKADLDEVIVRIKETDVYVRKKIGDLQNLLDTDIFFRIHRSCIVNINKIKSMQSIEQSKLQIHFKDIDDVITSSKDGAKEFREYLERRSL